MVEKKKMASELIAELQALVAKHGDQPVMVALPDDGSFAASTPSFDSDGEGDDCFII